MNNVTLLRGTLLGSALLACTAVSGCLISGDSHTQTSGQYVSADTLAQITPGKPIDYVIALLGEPTTKSSVSDGTEIWKWTATEHRKSSGGVLFIVGTNNETEHTRSAYVAFRGGVVEKAWRD